MELLDKSRYVVQAKPENVVVLYQLPPSYPYHNLKRPLHSAKTMTELEEADYIFYLAGM